MSTIYLAWKQLKVTLNIKVFLWFPYCGVILTKDKSEIGGEIHVVALVFSMDY
jgi:hypothetical protein